MPADAGVYWFADAFRTGMENASQIHGGGSRRPRLGKVSTGTAAPVARNGMSRRFFRNLSELSVSAAI